MCQNLRETAHVTIGEKIALVRTKKKPVWSQYHLAQVLADEGILGLDKGKWRSRIANYENRGDVPDELINPLASVLGVSPRWLSGDAGEPVVWASMDANAQFVDKEAPLPQLNLVPYWGIVPCGEWAMPDIGQEELVEISERVKDIRKVIAVRVGGNSMLPLFQPGELVSVRLSSTPLDGVVVLAKNQNGELTVKVMRYVDGEWQLHSINPQYGVASAESWSILGHVIYREGGDESGMRA